MIKLVAITAAFLSMGMQSNPVKVNAAAQPAAPKSIYDFKVPALDGSTIDFAAFKGKKILIVNTASLCGNTPQYEGLEKLYETHKDKLVIVGFPANNFGSQEPGTNGEIKEFCKKNYGVTFPMAAKVSVKGDDMAAIYQWLTNKAQNGVMDVEIKWNFGKFLLDEKGTLINYFAPKTQPMSEEITSKL
jgi:glutathione peroxidase